MVICQDQLGFKLAQNTPVDEARKANKECHSQFYIETDEAEIPRTTAMDSLTRSSFATKTKEKSNSRQSTSSEGSKKKWKRMATE